ncbi:MAG: sulfotransferase domain-containing protein, partial [Rubrobacter sp.]
TEVHYEDLLVRPNEEVERLLGFLGVDTGETLVERCVSQASFEKLSKGRERGEEDPSSFYRKGVAGDWKNLFDERDRQVYKEEAGELLIRLGYEKDGGW